MVERFMHAEGIVECQSVFVGPCGCGPAIHINLSKTKADGIFATAIIPLHEVDELLRQIKNCKRAIMRASQ